MNAEYKRDLQNNYLILKADQNLEPDDFRLLMAEQNVIPGLLPLQSARRDGELYLQYEITSLQPLESVYEKRLMVCDDILFLLWGLCIILENLQKFLLDPARLIFDPRFIYVDPDRRSMQLCYYPSDEAVFPVTELAEYILKRLDHRDHEAVALGYEFYQKASAENFSLYKMLKEVLEQQENGGGRSWKGYERAGAYQNDPPGNDGQRQPAGDSSFSDGMWKEHGSEAGSGREGIQSADSRIYESGSRAQTPGRDEYRNPPGDRQKKGISPDLYDDFQVTHKERKHGKKQKKKAGKVDRLFELIHPAVLLSGLFLLAVLEILFYLEYLTVTEAGGLFFLLISVETLINKFWRASREKKNKGRWEEEEDDEMYRLLQEEMYDLQEKDGVIEETQCLTQEEGMRGVRLICLRGNAQGESFPDICIGAEPVYIGKVKGESDIILDSPTVSRRHARLECRDGICFVRDLNSRNGTFLNGRRLRPQEQCQFQEGDELAFAEIRYRAVG